MASFYPSRGLSDTGLGIQAYTAISANQTMYRMSNVTHFYMGALHAEPHSAADLRKRLPPLGRYLQLVCSMASPPPFSSSSSLGIKK
jgi:hypothetical protein